MSANGKFRIGLNMRKNVETANEPKKSANIFGEESDDDEQQSAAEKFDRKYAASAGTKAREQRKVEKELADNPDIFEYDTHYEQIKQQRDQKVAAQKEADKEKKPKYAHLLVKAHKKRELNRLLVEENTYKKEREKEAGQFEDEEVFVTGAYRQQIEEREQHKTEMEREEALEKMRDVRDQKMWQQAFNRTMLENIARGPALMGEEDGVEEEKKQIKMEEEEDKEEQKMEEGEEKEPKVEVKEEQREEEKREQKGKEGEENERHGKKEERRRAKQRGEEEEEGATENKKRRRHERERTEERSEQQKEQDEEVQRMERIRQLLAKRNDQNAIEEAKKRYMERRREGEIRAPRIEATK